MIDLIQVKQRADLLCLSNHDTSLKKVASSGGGEWAGPCPFCGGHDRFRVQPYQQRWLCRGCSDGKWRDVIEFIARRDHLNPRRFEDLEEICIRASGKISLVNSSKTNIIQIVRTLKIPPNSIWQAQAHELIEHSEKMLWSSSGKEGREYLAGRGLLEETIRSWRLGYIAKPLRVSAINWGLQDPPSDVYIPSGVVIPCFISGDIWYIKIRQRYGRTPKYLNVKGSTPALFGADGF